MKQRKVLNEEIELNPSKYIVSKTDTRGIIEYANEYFVQISGYKEEELIGSPHNIIRHPDMPKIMFKIMWNRIQKGKDVLVLVKNLAKDGRYYWVTTKFEPNLDPITNEIVSHTAFRKAAPKKAVEKIVPIYEELLRIEKKSDMEASDRHLKIFLENLELSYDDFINQLISKSSNFSGLWKNIKKYFV